ncbi:MAG: hypothetical protein FWF25_09105 [Propionibacteriaceae bacterium]|nr:hypothetical protein [Propionibacteriaceae bacterium]
MTALSLTLLGLSGSLPAQAASIPVQGAACQPGQGVTVAVDNESVVDVRCAPGANGTIMQAFQAAGFDVGLGDYGMVASIDGLDLPTAYPQGWWALYTSTTTGTAAGTASPTWVFAQVGADNGPVTTDQAYLFKAVESWNADTSADKVVPALANLSTGDAALPATPSTTHGSANAGLAAAWIAAQLAASDDVMGSGSSTDWGLTIDALFSLASAGVGKEQIAATAAKINASGTAYIGTSASLATSWPAVAKTALALEVAGLDPAAMPVSGGTRNLLADLRSVVNADGSFGASDNIFSHALALLALARSTGGVPPIATNWLLAQQCMDATSANVGSFGWSRDCSSPDPDSSAMDVQALRAAGVADDSAPMIAAQAWLASQQDPSGGVASFGTLNTNSTGLLAQAYFSDTAITGPAATFIGNHQITCSVVASDAAHLTLADLGAISYDQAGFDSAVAQGLTPPATGQFLRASVQAVLGLGGPDFGTLSALGASTGLPSLTCTPPTPTPTPGTSPSPTPTPTAGISLSPTPTPTAGISLSPTPTPTSGTSPSPTPTSGPDTSTTETTGPDQGSSVPDGSVTSGQPTTPVAGLTPGTVAKPPLLSPVKGTPDPGSAGSSSSVKAPTGGSVSSPGDSAAAPLLLLAAGCVVLGAALWRRSVMSR